MYYLVMFNETTFREKLMSSRWWEKYLSKCSRINIYKQPNYRVILMQYQYMSHKKKAINEKS